MKASFKLIGASALALTLGLCGCGLLELARLLGGLGLERCGALGKLWAEVLADLVNVGVDKRGCVVLCGNAHRLKLREKLLARHSELFCKFMYSHGRHMISSLLCVAVLCAQAVEVFLQLVVDVL